MTTELANSLNFKALAAELIFLRFFGLGIELFYHFYCSFFAYTVVGFNTQRKLLLCPPQGDCIENHLTSKTFAKYL